MLNDSDLIFPDWPAPPNVKALQTTRLGGVSEAPYDSLNLGSHVGDSAINVERNRHLLNRFVPGEPVWLNQVHRTGVVNAAFAGCVPEADVAYTKTAHAVCAIMTADCLPVLLCDEQGSVVAAAHAGWKGLLAGVIENTIAAMQIDPNQLMAWLGPAIGPQAFEVGGDVREAFVSSRAESAGAFAPQANGRWLADIYLLARQRLHWLGVNRIYGGDFCTYTDRKRFFSYRRDGVTGRMASMIWLARL